MLKDTYTFIIVTSGRTIASPLLIMLYYITQPLQDHLFSTTLLTCRALSSSRCAVSLETWRNEQRLLQCHCHMAFLKTIFQLKLSYQLKALSSRRKTQSFVYQKPEQWMHRAKASPGSLINKQPLQDHLPTKTSCHLKSLSPGSIL